MTYRISEENNTQMEDEKGEITQLANFAAFIDKETRYDDGNKQETVLTISGKQGKKKLPTVEVTADKFPSLAWVLPAWGVRAVMQPGQSVKENLRVAIQLNSNPKTETVYTHTGWAMLEKEWVYLHASGGISAKGNDEKMRVLLPHELRHFSINTKVDQKKSVKNALAILKLGKPEIMWPLLAASLAPAIGPVDFALHITGRTGTFKSEVASLFQSFYGSGMDSRNLPGSWSSTANALEAQCFRAKNALFCVDDFIPTGTSWQVRAYQKTADQLLRGQGNQAGRARLTDTSNLQMTMYPRGLILSTGEDTPEGHSIRARMFIVELAPGDISTVELTKMQALREELPSTLGNFLQWLAPQYDSVQQELAADVRQHRDANINVGHSRTPTTIARLLATVHIFLNYAQSTKAIAENERRSIEKNATVAILATANQQSGYLESADPCEAFCEALRHMLAAHIGHLRTRDGGIPGQPERFGWTEESSKGDLPTYKSHGKCMGWMSWKDNEIYIDVTATYGDIRRHSSGQITFTKQTMLKRLKDAGLLTRVDESRQRNTVRVQCEGHPRTVLAMPLSTVLETNEVPSDE